MLRRLLLSTWLACYLVFLFGEVAPPADQISESHPRVHVKTAAIFGHNELKVRDVDPVSVCALKEISYRVFKKPWNVLCLLSFRSKVY